MGRVWMGQAIDLRCDDGGAADGLREGKNVLPGMKDRMLVSSACIQQQPFRTLLISLSPLVQVLLSIVAVVSR
jgi:hypothetical protein